MPPCVLQSAVSEETSLRLLYFLIVVNPAENFKNGIRDWGLGIRQLLEPYPHY